MKCSKFADELEQYLDLENVGDEFNHIREHLLACPDCQRLAEQIKEENEMIRQAIVPPPLPEGFTEQILAQLEPYPAPVPHPIRPETVPIKRSRQRAGRRWRRLLISSVATVFMLIVAGAYVSPTFASYLSTFISRIGGELGLKRAAELGFHTPVHYSVSDQGITLRVKEVLADPTRVVVSYVLEDEEGKLIPDLYIPTFDGNQIYVTDKDGNKINSQPGRFYRGSTYADFMFSLTEPPNNIIVHFDIKHFGSREKKAVNWKLDIPVDLQKSMAATKSIPINATYQSPYGILFEFGKVTYAPSATRIDLKTMWTPEETERVKRMAYAITGKQDEMTLRNFGAYRFDYRIIDQNGKVVADSQHDPTNTSKRTIYFSPNASQTLGTLEWHGAFVPGEQEESLTFVLDSLEKTEPADFSITFAPDTVQQAPVSKAYEQQGARYSVMKAEKTTDEATNEPVWAIELEGVQKDMEFPQWIAIDEKGNRYETEMQFHPHSEIEHREDGKHLRQYLLIRGVNGTPKKFTLSMLTITKRYDDVHWSVPIPKSK